MPCAEVMLDAMPRILGPDLGSAEDVPCAPRTSKGQGGPARALSGDIAAIQPLELLRIHRIS